MDFFLGKLWADLKLGIQCHQFRALLSAPSGLLDHLSGGTYTVSVVQVGMMYILMRI